MVEIDQGRRFEIAAHAASLGVWDWDLRTNAITYSARAKEISGFGKNTAVTFEDVRSVVHPDDLPRTSAMAQRAFEPDNAGAEPFRYRIIRADTGETRWVLAHGETIFEHRDGSAEAVRYIGTLQDITDQHDAEAALTESEERLRFAVEAGKMAVWEIDLDHGRITPSPELNVLCGFPPDVQPTLDDFRSRYAPGEAERIELESAELRARGETEIQTSFRQLWPDGTEKWLLLRARLAPPSRTIQRRVVGVLIDITVQKLAEQRAETIAAEMQHRVKNTLAVVQTLAEQSLRNKPDIAAASNAFSGRLRALAAANGAMTGGWSGSELHLLVELVTKPYRDGGVDPFSIEGATVKLPSKLATALALALHELATNAVKYGALSKDGGQVSISWHMDGNKLYLRWLESGGPAVSSERQSGFGTRLLERGLFEPGEAVMVFAPDGVIWNLVTNLESSEA